MIPLHFFQPCRPSKVPFANLQCASCAAWDQIRRRHVGEGPEHHPKVWSQPSNCEWLRNPAPVGSLSRCIILFIGFYTDKSFVFATPWSSKLILLHIFQGGLPSYVSVWPLLPCGLLSQSLVRSLRLQYLAMSHTFLPGGSFVLVSG